MSYDYQEIIKSNADNDPTFAKKLKELRKSREDVVDREAFSEDDFPFERGDELIAIDGESTEGLMEKFVTYCDSGNPLTRKAKAAYLLTYRPGKTVPVPTGSVTLSIRRKGETKIDNIVLEWKNEGDRFDENSVPTQEKVYLKSSTVNSPENDPSKVDGEFSPIMLSMFDILDDAGPYAERSYHCNGGTRIAIPEGATVLMEEPFVAYYHPTDFGNVGYLRIPHYYPQAFGGSTQQWLEHNMWVLDKLEEETVGLTIDQDHNCGGSVSYLEDVVSLFMSRPFDPLLFQYRASKRELLNWKGWLGSFDKPYYMMYENILYVYNLLEKAFQDDEYLTPKTSFRGEQLVEPLGVYTKPVLILIDYMAGSGGDAFPAMMQGLGRAKLLGTTTAGLGGHVRDMEPLFYSQLRTRMTQSLFYHPDGTPIENNGAKPDIDYEITAEDFVNEFRDYQQFYLKALKGMLR